MQVVYIILTVSKLYSELLPAQKGKVSHLKDGLAFHAVDAPDGLSNAALHLHQKRDTT